MIITKKMFDEFVESAENHTILWTDTLALIGVTVGDVPDVDVIEAQAAENARLREALLVASVALSMIDAPPQNEARAIVDAAIAQETQP